jgi:hypothetical protein
MVMEETVALAGGNRAVGDSEAASRRRGTPSAVLIAIVAVLLAACGVGTRGQNRMSRRDVDVSRGGSDARAATRIERDRLPPACRKEWLTLVKFIVNGIK